MEGLALILSAASALAGVVVALNTDYPLLERPGRRRGQLFRVVLPVTDRDPEVFFRALHGLLHPLLHRLIHGQENIGVELLGTGHSAYLRLFIPDGLYLSVERLLRASYPVAQLVPDDDEVRHLPVQAVAAVRLHRDSFLPLREKADDPLNFPLLMVLGEPGEREAIEFQLLIQPLPAGWRGRMLLRAARLRQGRRGQLLEAILGGYHETPISHVALLTAQQIEQKSESLPFVCAMRVLVRGQDRDRAHGLLRDVAASLRPFAGPNSFEFDRVLNPRRFARQYERRRAPIIGRFILTARELGQLWSVPKEPPAHLVHSTLPVPVTIPQAGRVLGVAPYGTPPRTVAQPLLDARTHLHVVGPTGRGKSTLLLNLVNQDIVAGRGVAVLDPTRDLVSDVLARLPRERLDDVVLISPHERGHSVGINPLHVEAGEEPERVADNVLASFRRVYEQTGWGPRTNELLRSALLTLCRVPGATLAHIPMLLQDPSYRAEILQDLSDPIGVGSFWAWYESLTDGQRVEVVSPLLNRVRPFVSLPRVRRLLCQPTPTVDLADLVASGGILLADLSTALWGESTARLVGSLLFSQLWLAARNRLTVPEAARSPFFVYVDEFANFISLAGSFAETLAQARRLALPLTLAHQHLGQLSPEMREAVIGNAGTRVLFQAGQEDARYFAREFAPLDATAIMNLPRFEAAVRLSIDGQTSRPFVMRTLPKPEVSDPEVANDATRRSAQLHGRPVAEIDHELREALHLNDPTPPVRQIGRRSRR
jgi:hypothetical protein